MGYIQGVHEALLWAKKVLQEASSLEEARRELQKALEELQEAMTRDFRHKLRWRA